MPTTSISAPRSGGAESRADRPVPLGAGRGQGGRTAVFCGRAAPDRPFRGGIRSGLRTSLIADTKETAGPSSFVPVRWYHCPSYPPFAGTFPPRPVRGGSFLMDGASRTFPAPDIPLHADPVLVAQCRRGRLPPPSQKCLPQQSEFARVKLKCQGKFLSVRQPSVNVNRLDSTVAIFGSGRPFTANAIASVAKSARRGFSFPPRGSARVPRGRVAFSDPQRLSISPKWCLIPVSL